MYKNEAMFSRALLTKLKQDKGLFIQRIETALTSRGVPDLYIAGIVNSRWFELKNKPFDNINAVSWSVPWREGQQAWMNKYFRITHQVCFTIMAVKDGFIWIPMFDVYHNNKVSYNDPAVKCIHTFGEIAELIRSVTCK